jgi:type IV secretion system protein VirB5
MKKKLVIALAAVFMLAGNASATGIPVVDVAGNLQNMVNHVESIANMVQQVEQLKAQLNQARQMYTSMNGARGMAALLNNPTARQYLPKEASDIYALATSSKFSSISGSLATIKKAAQLVDAGNVRNTATSQGLDKQQTLLASVQASAEASYKAAGDRFEQLQTLVDSVDLAVDPKAAADLQNRIAAEQVMMQNESAKLSMMMQLQAIQEKQLVQQGREQKARFGQGKQAVYATGF